MSKLAILEGYSFGKYKRKGGKGSRKKANAAKKASKHPSAKQTRQRAKFKAAAKHCQVVARDQIKDGSQGMPLKLYGACMRRELKK